MSSLVRVGMTKSLYPGGQHNDTKHPTGDQDLINTMSSISKFYGENRPERM